MKIVIKKIEEIKPYEKNPRRNDEAVNAVAESIKQFGFKTPMVIDKNNVIVCGHTRYKASKKLGLKTVPCVIADDLTEEQIKAFRLADNKVAEKAEWDFDFLDDEMADIIDIDMSLFGFLDESNFDHIQNLLDEEFCDREINERFIFSSTFLFPTSRKDMIDEFLKTKDKSAISQFIIDRAEGETEHD